MMRLLLNSNKDVKIDVYSAFKSVWVTNALDSQMIIWSVTRYLVLF